MVYRVAFTVFVFTGSIGLCLSQGITTVRWESRIESINARDAIVVLKATVLPGWHLYSQHIADGGPQPTQIAFRHDSAFAATGEADEKGEAVRFHDKTYDLEIIWYSGTVEFYQRVQVNDPRARLQGEVTYMTCNTQVCMPGHYYFSLRLPEI